MLEVFAALSFLSLLHAALSFSLLRRRWRTPLIWLCALAIFLCRDMAAALNIGALYKALADRKMVETIGVAMVMQSTLALLLGFALCQRRSLQLKIPFFLYFPLLPPLLFPAGAFAGLVWLFNRAGPAMGFAWAAAFYCAGLGVFMTIISELASALLSNDAQKAETLSLLHVAQVFGGMFFPALLSTSFKAFAISWEGLDAHSLLCLLAMALFVGLSFIIRFFYGSEDKKQKSKFRIQNSEIQGSK